MTTAPTKRGLLLINLGTPDAPTEDAIRRYLKEFLSDPKVVTLPQWLWRPILNNIILRTRPSRLVERYQSIWTTSGEEGGDSPIRYFGEQLAVKVALALGDTGIVVRSAMTYGTPSISQALESLVSSGVEDVLAIPLFPQYTSATTGAVAAAIERSIAQLSDRYPLENDAPGFSLSMVDDYHDHPEYIDALCTQLAPFRDNLSEPGCKLILSYHGIPMSQSRNDPYLEQCRTSSELITHTLELPPDSWEMTFQSRFGPMRWLSPYTDERIKVLGMSGVEHLIVACPGFAVDCLETLDEINVENREYFLEAGGTTFTYIQALNDKQCHIDLLSSIAEQHWSHAGSHADVRASSGTT
ncbi:MAG: ferrochelatase [Pseudomonadota bacterium]